MKKIRTYFIILISFLLFSNCGRKNIPFQSKKEKQYIQKLRKSSTGIVTTAKDSSWLYIPYEYRIRIGDQLTVRMNGIPVGQNITAEDKEAGVPQETYTVNEQGNILLPVIGFQNVLGKTLREASESISDAYKKHYKEPAVDIYFSNLRTYVYKGNEASVVQLNRTQTDLYEVLAQAGGLHQKYKLKQVKILRRERNKREIIWVDLRKLRAWEHPALIVHADDVIYLEPRNLYYFMEEIRPYVSLITLGGSISGYLFILTRLGIIK